MYSYCIIFDPPQVMTFVLCANILDSTKRQLRASLLLRKTRRARKQIYFPGKTAFRSNYCHSFLVEVAYRRAMSSLHGAQNYGLRRRRL